MPIDPGEFRRILSHYPTGVCGITSVVGDRPIGMVVGSFTSVSLDPPLVGFFPDRRSDTWRNIREAGRFCVNVLGMDQLAICKALSAKGTNKFAGLDYRLSDTGLPILGDVAAWMTANSMPSMRRVIMTSHSAQFCRFMRNETGTPCCSARAGTGAFCHSRWRLRGNNGDRPFRLALFVARFIDH